MRSDDQLHLAESRTCHFPQATNSGTTKSVRPSAPGATAALTGTRYVAVHGLVSPATVSFTTGERNDDELKAGEISIHSDLLLHGSEPNQSKRRRYGLTLRYCPTSVRAELGWNAKGVVASGKDESGHWANPRRPECD